MADEEAEQEIRRALDVVQSVQSIQSIIDISADRLEGLRTQCATSAEITQQEIRTLEVFKISIIYCCLVETLHLAQTQFSLIIYEYEYHCYYAKSLIMYQCLNDRCFK